MMTNEEKIKQAIKLLEESAHPFDAAATLLREALEENEEPKKQIDWSKMPVDTLGEVSLYGDNWFKRYFAGMNRDIKAPYLAFPEGATSFTLSPLQPHVRWRYIRLIEQPTVTFWQGGECPIPDGVRFEYYTRFDANKPLTFDCAEILRWCHVGRNDDIIGYRILGPAEGWE